MEYLPQASLRDRKMQYLSLLGYPQEQITPVTYNRLVETVKTNPPEFGQGLNETVVQNALDRGLNQDVLTGILAAGPPIRLMVEQELPAVALTQELVGLTKNYYQKQIDLVRVNAKDFVANAAVVLKQAENSMSVAVFSAYGSAVASFGHLAVTSKNAERSVLNAVPFGLGHLAKRGLQLSAPAILLNVGEHLPVVGSGIKALNMGISAISTFGAGKIGTFAESRYLLSHLPTPPSIDAGLFSSVTNAAKGAYYQAQVFSVHQSANLVKAWATGFSHTVFSIGAPNALLLGTLAASKRFRSAIREGAIPFSGLAVQSKFLIKSIQEKFSMSEQNGKQSAASQYMDLLKGHAPTQGMNYEQIKAQSEIDHTVGSEANRYVAQAAADAGKTSAEIREIIQAAPSVVGDLERGTATQADINNYLREFDAEFIRQVTPETSAIAPDPVIPEVIAPEVIAPEVVAPEVVAPEVAEAPSMSDQDKAINQGILSTLGTTFGVDKLRHAQINYNGEAFFKLENYVETKSVQTPEDRQAADMFQKALSDPSNVKGDVKISIGSQLLVHVKDGVVILGHQFVKDNSLKAEINSPEKSLYDKYSAPIQSSGYEKTRQVAAVAFNAGKSVEEVRGILMNDPSFKKYEEQSPEMNMTMLSQVNAQAQAVGKGISLEKQPERTKEVAIAV